MASDRPSAEHDVLERSTIASNVQPIVSLLIVIHLFIVTIALSGNLARSQFQTRLLAFFAPYAQSLNIDLNFTPYHLTHAMPSDADHRIEWRAADAEDDAPWHSMPDRGAKAGERYKRYQRLAAIMSFFAERNDDSTVGVLARGVGTYVLNQEHVKPGQIRVRKHLPQSMSIVSSGTPDERDANSEVYFEEVYRANAIVTDATRVDIIKVQESGQVARPDSDQ